MPVDEGLLRELERFNECMFKPTMSSGNFTVLNPLCWVTNSQTLTSLEVANSTPIQKANMKMSCSNLDKLVYTSLCVSYSEASLITGTIAHNEHKNHIKISRGRSLIGQVRVLNPWPFLLVPKFPSLGNFGEDGHKAVGTSHVFPRFSKKI